MTVRVDHALVKRFRRQVGDRPARQRRIDQACGLPAFPLPGLWTSAVGRGSTPHLPLWAALGCAAVFFLPDLRVRRDAAVRRREPVESEGRAGGRPQSAQSMLVARPLLCAGFVIFLGFPAAMKMSGA